MKVKFYDRADKKCMVSVSVIIPEKSSFRVVKFVCNANSGLKTIRCNKIEIALKTYDIECEVNGEIRTAERIESIINEVKHGGKEAPIKTDFFSVAQRWIEESETRRMGGKQLSKDVVNSYKRAIEYLKQYKGFTGHHVSFTSMNVRFYENFSNYILDNLEKSPNYFGKLVKNLKVFLNWCIQEDIQVNPEFKKFKVINISKAHQATRLTIEEVERIINLDLTQELHKQRPSNRERHLKHLELARDYFLGMLATGCHVKQFMALTMDNVKGDKIEYTRSKTDIEVVGVPFFDHSIFKIKELVEKHGLPFPRKDEQKINDALKVVARLAGIDKNLTNKVARCTFASVLYYNQNVEISDIMLMLGHTKESTTRRYLGADSSDVASRVRMKISSM